MPISFAISENEYVKNPELRKKDVQALQEWVQKQAHLPKLTEFEVILFLQSCYFKAEEAKSAIEYYYTFRTQMIDLFSKRNPRTINYTVLFSILPKTPDGHLNLYSRLYDMRVEKWDMKESFILFEMVRSLGFAQFGSAKGSSLIVDCEGISLAHSFKLNIVLLAKIVFYLQDAIPVRLKHIHVISLSSVIDKLVTMLKPLVKKEIFELIQFHSNLESLYKFVPKESLPNERGGSFGTFSELLERTKRNLIENEDFFKQDETKLVDESKRIGKSLNIFEIGAGIDGTFKKLDID